MDYLKQFDEKQLVFIIGIHRSGTTILSHFLGEQAAISGFENTGFPSDEGQYLQTVFPIDVDFGGVGKFAFKKKFAYTEASELVTEANRKSLIEGWCKHWDLSKSILVEKSPPNIIRTRFLQAMFPNAKFITIFRHPIAVSYATQKWAKTSFRQLLKHWTTAHKIYLKDRPKLKQEFCFTYEELVSNPEKILSALSDFIGIDIKYSGEFRNSNKNYFERWHGMKYEFLQGYQRKALIIEFEKAVRKFGYSMLDLNKFAKQEDLFK